MTVPFLLFTIFVIAIVALAVFIVKRIPVPAPFDWIIIALACLIGIVAVAQRAGVI